MEKIKACNRVLRELKDLGGWQINDIAFYDSNVAPMGGFTLIKLINYNIVTIHLYVYETGLSLKKDLDKPSHFKLDDVDEISEWIRNVNMGS